jgi:predicted ATPase/DNA-binding CsgD family transcriptional regulator
MSGDNPRTRQVTTANNLPAELTSFVGREPQLAELRRLLHRSRLITLTGPGGSGKTRLALRLSTEVLDRYPGGAWLVDLAPLSDGMLLGHTLAAVCGIKEESKRPVAEVLASGLASRTALILLDGCEHLVDSCAELASGLLRTCPRLAMIATSREPLGVTGEVIWRTPSLTVPRSEVGALPELLMESEAIRLFVDRARLSLPDFELARANAAAVAQICARLEGIPLAIELAARLVGVMTVQEILERLRNRFRVLTGGSRSALPRHQTLRQAVDWSYGLLSSSEQALFVRLGVFAGGFDLHAAEAVVNQDPGDADKVLPLLTRLVDKSLVEADSGRPKTTRYRMLDTIHEYALEKLPESEQAELRRRHAVYFREWSARATVELESADQYDWLRRLDEEQANIRLAIEWSLVEQPDDALRLVGAMDAYWWMRRHLEEGLAWLGRALEVPTSNETLRALALGARARLSRRRGDYEAAGRDAEESAAISRRLGLIEYLTRALTMLGIVASEMGDTEAASTNFNAALELAQQHGIRKRIVTSLNNLAVVDFVRGDLVAAQRQAEEALRLAESLADRFVKANILETVAKIQLRLGEHDKAARRYAEALTIAAEFEDPMTSADCMEGLALLAALHSDPARTIVLMAAAQGMRSRSGAERTLRWSEDIEAGLARARSKVGRVAADTAWKRGAGFSMQEAARFALGGPAEPAPDGQGRLTDRETEVARLIASGQTNGEVAALLRISARTVDAHVEHIRNKLGLRTRAQIAVWAHERLGKA